MTSYFAAEVWVRRQPTYIVNHCHRLIPAKLVQDTKNSLAKDYPLKRATVDGKIPLIMRHTGIVS